MCDLISRKALRDAMYHEAFEKDSEMQKWDSGCWIRYKMFENLLKDAPSVPAVPVRHGRWKPSPYLEGMYKCSACGDEWGASAKMIPMLYCPACGAKMDLKDE